MGKNPQRQRLMTCLSVERAGLLEGLLRLDEQTLTKEPVLGAWTIKDILVHIAAWDRWEERTMRSMVAGEDPDFTALRDFDLSNEKFVAAWRNRSLDEVMDELMSARSGWVTWLESLPDEEFFQPRYYSGYEWTFSKIPLQVQWEHDVVHAGQIAEWIETGGLKSISGPKSVLLAALNTARQELLNCAALMPVEEWESIPVCGDWTLKDVFGHITDWEWHGVEVLRYMSQYPTVEQPPILEPIDNVEIWNIKHVEARRGQSWDKVWEDLLTVREAFLDVISGMKQVEMELIHSFPWGGEETPYEWVVSFQEHDREHGWDLFK